MKPSSLSHTHTQFKFRLSDTLQCQCGSTSAHNNLHIITVLTFDPLVPSDLMTEMMDMSSDLVGSGIPFLDYRMYAERIFFPGHRESPLRRDLDVQECRRQTVEQGLVQLSNLLNSKLFLTKVAAGARSSPHLI